MKDIKVGTKLIVGGRHWEVIDIQPVTLQLWSKDFGVSIWAEAPALEAIQDAEVEVEK
jgi:hypothetical protein